MANLRHVRDRWDTGGKAIFSLFKVMKMIGDLVLPLILVSVVVYACRKGTNVFGAMTAGAKNGLTTVLGILPALVTLLPCISMLRASGALDALCSVLRVPMSYLGIPAETVPLMLTRPLSGSGALAIGSEIMSTSGTDSFAGRCAAVMLGSTETTFYVIAVYFGAAGIKKSRHAVPAALVADLAGFFFAAFFVRLLWG